MKIYLRDINPMMVHAWARAFKDESDIEVSQGDIFALQTPVDAIVSPANSFGFMDGGIDFFYSNYFGWDLQKRLQAYLGLHHNGELLVGQAVAVETKNKRIPWCISAPTMRVPMDVSDTVHAYLAFRATLKIAKEMNFKSILCPGLGTAVGGMMPEMCAYQMWQAYQEFKIDQKSIYPTLADASKHHYQLKGLKLEFPPESLN